MRKSLTVASICVLTIVGLTLPATAITGNYEEDHDRDGVGMLVTYDDDGEFAGRCSGTLVTPTVFLTAGHCTDGAADARVYFEQDAGKGYVPATATTPEQPAPSGYPVSGGVRVAFVEEDGELEPQIFTMPGYDDFATFPDTEDVGVVVLERPVEATTYAALLEPGRLDVLAAGKAKRTVMFDVSGYGLNYINGAKVVSYRERMTATAQLVNTKSQPTDGANFAHSGNASQGKGGTCFGDSGGPVYLAGTDTIAGVTSFGMSAMSCSGPGYAYRVDQQKVIDFVAGFVAEGETLKLSAN